MILKLHITVMFILISIMMVTLISASDDCFSKEKRPKRSRQYSTKTFYDENFSETKSNFNFPDCTPIKFWMLSRHGTTLPDAKNIKKLEELEVLKDKIIENYEINNYIDKVGFLCKGDLTLLRKWWWDKNITKEFQKHLTVNGWNEMKNLAVYYKNIFADLFTNKYSKERFLFRHTNTQRTNASFMAFTQELFGKDNNVFAERVSQPDKLLRLYHYCEEWQENSRKMSYEGSELTKFLESDIYKKLISDVSKKLGFDVSSNQIIDAEKVETIYDMCRYDQAWNHAITSSWCSIFTSKQIDLLEYKEDLKYFYESGYGSPINSVVSCLTVDDMLKHLDRNETDKLDIVAYFTHSSMIHTFLVSLNAFHDSIILMADNYNDAIHREWKTSSISPYASNFVAVKYFCKNEKKEPYKVKFFLNEEPLIFDWCKKNEICDWEVAKEKYKQSDNCYSEKCTINSGSHQYYSLIGIATLQIVYYILFYFKQ